MSQTPGEAFWEEHYRSATPLSGGRPSATLVRFAGDLRPGTALDLGCARGDDAVWLAGKGWRVVGVDVSEAVIGYAAANAARAGVADRIRLKRHDLSVTFPEGRFDLVTALFLESPVAFPRAAVLRRAAEAVASSGTLLIAEHASRAPWSWGADAAFPAAAETLQSLKLDPEQWRERFVGTPERVANGPGGQTAVVRDNVIVLEHLG